MLPYIIGGVLVAAVGVALGEKEEKHKKKRKKQLRKQADTYTAALQQRQKKNRYNKEKILFGRIKEEQASLKAERRRLYRARNHLARGSRGYAEISARIDRTTFLIEQKQKDADKIKTKRMIRI
jgi:uncharacterized protein HemX